MKNYIIVASVVALFSAGVNASPLDQKLEELIARYCDLMHFDGYETNIGEKIQSRWNRDEVQELLTPTSRRKGDLNSSIFKECRPVETKFPFIVVAQTLPASRDTEPNIVRYRAEEIRGKVYIVPFRISGRSVEVFDDCADSVFPRHPDSGGDQV